MSMISQNLLNSAKSFFLYSHSEITGSHKFLFACLLSVFLFVVVVVVVGSVRSSSVSLASSVSRYNSMLSLAHHFLSMSPASFSSPSQSRDNLNLNADVASVFAQVADSLSLGNRLQRITPEGENISVEINRLYAEELAQLQSLLASRGVKIIAAEIRALPSGRERLFSVSALIAPSNS